MARPVGRAIADATRSVSAPPDLQHVERTR